MTEKEFISAIERVAIGVELVNQTRDQNIIIDGQEYFLVKAGTLGKLIEILGKSHEG